MVCPAQTASGPKHSSDCGASILGDVPELLSRINATAQVAPAFRDVVRSLLQQQEVLVEGQNLFLARLGSCQRYDSAFRRLYA
mgnify:CR=1 FL=1